MPVASASRPSRSQIASRVAAGLIGGWAMAWGFVTLSIALLLLAGMSYADAQTLVYLLAFLVFLVALCWSFSASSVTRVWLVFVVGSSAMTAMAWWLTRTPA